MKPPGVIANARARRSGRDARLVERLRRHLPAEYVHFTHDASEVDAALARLHALGIEHLVLVGGDGTVGGTLTPLVARYGESPLPRVSLVAGGTINTIAHSLDAHASAEQTVRRILEDTPPRLDSVRPLIRVEPDTGPARGGLIFANGVGARWLERYYQGDELGVVAAAGLVGRIAASALLRRRLARELFAARAIEISVDAARLDARAFTVAGAASVRDVGLGFRPFLSAGTDPERFHFLYSAATAARLSVELPALRLGFHGPTSCLHHYPARTVELRFEVPEPWSIDADLYPPATRLRLSAWAPIRFISY
ncbi:MAG: diacylglycerol kinase family protein [Myxococcota bacterium]